MGEGVRLQDVADALGVSRQTLDKWRRQLNVQKKFRSRDLREDDLFRLWVCNYLRYAGAHSDISMQIAAEVSGDETGYLVYSFEEAAISFHSTAPEVPADVGSAVMTVIALEDLRKQFSEWRTNALYTNEEK